jgi:L-fucose isomerase-like protein
MLVMDFVRKLNKPLMYYGENNPMAGSLSHLAATCASLMEWGVNKHALAHERCFGNRGELAAWARAAGAAARMREGALLLWGGSYAVGMEQLQDDVPRLKSFMVRDVLQEDQLVLVKRAEKILAEGRDRTRRFVDWLEAGGLRIAWDGKMLTREAFEKQAALLLAARGRLEELEGENVLGVSVKCQPEIYHEWGVDACTLPAFLPFAASEEGERKVYPTVCEGDIKGLLTSVLLHALNPGVPPAFGDLVSVGDDHVEFANCGAGSLYWAAGPTGAAGAGEALRNTEAVPNIHGVSGAAFSYYGRALPAVTVARLTRIRGEHVMQVGVGRALDAREFLARALGDGLKDHLGAAWGKVVVDLGVRGENFVKVVGANHLSATEGDFSREIETVCRLWGIPVLRVDSDREMEAFYREVRLRAGR